MATPTPVIAKRYSPEWIPLLAKTQRVLNDRCWQLLFSREPDPVRARAKAILEDAEAVAEHIAGTVSTEYVYRGGVIDDLISKGIAAALATPRRTEGIL